MLTLLTIINSIHMDANQQVHEQDYITPICLNYIPTASNVPNNSS